jgi:hypothetical protein
MDACPASACTSRSDPSHLRHAASGLRDECPPTRTEGMADEGQEALSEEGRKYSYRLTVTKLLVKTVDAT